MEYFTLSNGAKIPALGSGTLTFGRADSERFESPLNGDFSGMESAIQVGYRMFDTAMAYGNEEGLGECLQKSGVPREEFFIMGKIPNRAPYNESPKNIREAVEASMKNLRIDYFDMFLIHKAVDNAEAMRGGKMDLSKTLGIWNVLTELIQEGKLRGIGISNFDVEQMELFLKDCGVVPMVNELRSNPAVRNMDSIRYCKEHNILPIAHSPLSGSIGPGIFADCTEYKAKLSEVGKKYHKHWAQVQLRSNYQLGMASIPRSSIVMEQISDLDIFDFCLTDEEMEALNGGF